MSGIFDAAIFDTAIFDTGMIGAGRRRRRDAMFDLRRSSVPEPVFEAGKGFVAGQKELDGYRSAQVASLAKAANDAVLRDLAEEEEALMLLLTA